MALPGPAKGLAVDSIVWTPGKNVWLAEPWLSRGSDLSDLSDLSDRCRTAVGPLSDMTVGTAVGPLSDSCRSLSDLSDASPTGTMIGHCRSLSGVSA